MLASGDGPEDRELPVEGKAAKVERVKGSTQRHVGLTLSLHMSERGDSCFPGVGRIAEECGLSDRSVQRALRALERGGWLAVEFASAGVGTNLYTATIPGDVASPGGVTSRRPGGDVGTPEDVIEDVKNSPTERETRDALAAAWGSHPALVAHRAAYFATSKATTAIRGALAVYPLEEVVAAIGLYATVLAGDEYRWSYRWTFVDFLGRGLDRFVPSSDPLGNYRSRDRRKPTADDFPDLDVL